MSKEKPKKEYTTVVKKYSNSGRIKAYKSHIGKKVRVIVETKRKPTKFEDDMENAGNDGWN